VGLLFDLFDFFDGHDTSLFGTLPLIADSGRKISDRLLTSD
jgi:hypothetical protein